MPRIKLEKGDHVKVIPAEDVGIIQENLGNGDYLVQVGEDKLFNDHVFRYNELRFICRKSVRQEQFDW